MRQLWKEIKEINKSGCPCFYTEPRRLYIREGPRGRQKFVPWGITCIRCGFVFSKRPIRISKNQIEWDELTSRYFKGELSKEQYAKCIENWRQGIREQGLEQIKIAKKGKTKK
jgi:hypothetical protein